MTYPEDFTAEDIMIFEYELNRHIDMTRDEGLFWAVNAECQVVAQEQQEAEQAQWV